MLLDPSRLSVADRYKLLIGLVAPRPIALVSTVGAAGAGGAPGPANLAPFSFFNAVGAEPMTLLFCPANGPDGAPKDTLRNCLPPAEGGTGEFVVNLVDEAIAGRMAVCAEPLPYGDSEFALSGLTPETSVRVRPARVRESVASFECVVRQVIRLAPGAPSGGNVVLGEVLCVHVRAGVVDERMHTDPGAADLIGRLGGQGYCRTRDRFEIPRGRAALEAPGA